MTPARLRNLTPHTLRFLVDESVFEIPPEGTVPRVRFSAVEVDRIDVDGNEVPLVETRAEGVDELPEQLDGVWLVVSRTLAEALPDRTDLVVPDDLERDASGAVTGARRLMRPGRSG